MALTANYIPARRATRIDPMAAPRVAEANQSGAESCRRPHRSTRMERQERQHSRYPWATYWVKNGTDTNPINANFSPFTASEGGVPANVPLVSWLR